MYVSELVHHFCDFLKLIKQSFTICHLKKNVAGLYNRLAVSVCVCVCAHITVIRVYCKCLPLCITMPGCQPPSRQLCSWATMWGIYGELVSLVCLRDRTTSPPNNDGWAPSVSTTLAFWWKGLWDRKHGNLSQACELVFYSIKLVSRRTHVYYRLTWWTCCGSITTTQPFI